jgi:heme exporter protein A
VTDEALDLRGISKVWGRSAALKRVDLRLERGEVLALLGPNGAGKTTLLKIIAGALAPTLGEGTILGHDLRDREPLRSRVGLLAPDSHLYDDLTAIENLEFTMTMAGKPSSRGELVEWLRTVDLASQSRRRVRDFSSGMKRRLALARVLALQPELLLLDEPYTNLDDAGADLVDRLVRQAREERRTVLLATHDADRATALADVVARLEGGKLAYLSRTAPTTTRPTHRVG